MHTKQEECVIRLKQASENSRAGLLIERGPCTTVTSLAGEIGIRIRAMRIRVKPTVAALLCGLALCASWAQEGRRKTKTLSTNANQGQKTDRTLSPDDGSYVIPAPQKSRARRNAGPETAKN